MASLVNPADMGCDIHCYIEYREPGRESWSGFGGRINPGRNYWIFGALAGVRADHIPHLEPRGFPLDCGYSTWDDNTIYVSDDQVEPWENDSGSTFYSRAHAEEYVGKGYCQYVARGSSHRSFVTRSDHHSHSWLTPDEYETAIGAYLKANGFQIGSLKLCAPEGMRDLSKHGSDQGYALAALTEYWAILHAMRCFETQGKESRLVFWFDN